MSAGHAAWDELAAGYAVNALEPEDEHAFLDHLRGCDRCRATLDELTQVTGQLGYAVEPAEPPDELRRRILDAAAAERPAVFGTTPPVTALGAARERRRAPAVRLGSLTTAAAVLVVFALGAWNLTLRGDTRAKQEALQRRDKALTCLAAPDSRKFTMTSAGGERATSCLSGGRAYLVVDRLDRNDRASSLYVLWWMGRDDGLHPVGGFDVDAAGTAVYELPLGAGPADVKAMAISLEQGRDVPAAPTRRIVYGEAASA